jgi:hypothetical protein
MKKFETIEFEIIENTGIIWLNRPDKHNAMNDIMISEIIDWGICEENMNIKRPTKRRPKKNHRTFLTLFFIIIIVNQTI